MNVNVDESWGNVLAGNVNDLRFRTQTVLTSGTNKRDLVSIHDHDGVWDFLKRRNSRTTGEDFFH
jgi:hypothetical protein